MELTGVNTLEVCSFKKSYTDTKLNYSEGEHLVYTLLHNQQALFFRTVSKFYTIKNKPLKMYIY
jgi:hypothetical protein